MHDENMYIYIRTLPWLGLPGVAQQPDFAVTADTVDIANSTADDDNRA